MGTWGPKLYQDDLAEDVRDYYKEQLSKGKKGVDISQELLVKYQAEILDSEEASVFWFSLADTQWNLGRLEDRVKEMALRHIESGQSLERWKTIDPKMLKTREQAIQDLRQKLLSPQPPEKKVAQQKIYRCEWKCGDAFAYLLESDLAKERGLYGRYFLIQKVDEGTWYPGHVTPIVYIKITKDGTLPANEEEFDGLEYVQTAFSKFEERFWPIDMSRPAEDIAEKSKIKYRVDEYGYLPQYRINLLNTSKRVIPKKLIYLGNFKNSSPPENEFIPHSKFNILQVYWKHFGDTFETKMLERYCFHNLRELSIYKK